MNLYFDWSRQQEESQIPDVLPFNQNCQIEAGRTEHRSVGAIRFTLHFSLLFLGPVLFRYKLGNAAHRRQALNSRHICPCGRIAASLPLAKDYTAVKVPSGVPC